MAQKNDKETGFEKAIRQYLEAKAASDPLFAPTYAKKNKSIKECCAYIRSEAKKKAVAGCAVLTDDDVYGMAVHYYDEDSIKVENAPQAKVTTSAKPKPAPAPKAAPAAPQKPVEPKKLTKKELKRGDDCFSLFSFD